MSIQITTPVEGFTGVSVGVSFVDGTASVDELTDAQAQYFDEQGYTVTGADSAPKK